MMCGMELLRDHAAGCRIRKRVTASNVRRCHLQSTMHPYPERPFDLTAEQSGTSIHRERTLSDYGRAPLRLVPACWMSPKNIGAGCGAQDRDGATIPSDM